MIQKSNYLSQSLIILWNFTRLSITKWLVGGQFTTTKFNIGSRLLDSEFVRFKRGSLMTSVAKWLFHTLSATAPSVDFVMNFWIFNGNRPHHWTDWFWRLLWGCNTSLFLLVLFMLDISKVLNVQVWKVSLIETYWRILRLLNPSLWFNWF